jgi:holo-[acyl-carrier protein] synthase
MKPAPTLLERTRDTRSAGPRSRRRAAPDRSAGPGVRVGVDLVPVVDVAESVRRFGARYLDRIFTPHEVDCCRRANARTSQAASGYSAESLAARFAAKEATVKVLRPAGFRPDWRSIEVRRVSGGWCEIHLSGLAATLAADAGIDELEVSLTHESMVAVAVVVGRCTGDGAGAGAEEGRQTEGPSTEGEP